MFDCIIVQGILSVKYPFIIPPRYNSPADSILPVSSPTHWVLVAFVNHPDIQAFVNGSQLQLLEFLTVQEDRILPSVINGQPVIPALYVVSGIGGIDDFFYERMPWRGPPCGMHRGSPLTAHTSPSTIQLKMADPAINQWMMTTGVGTLVIEVAF